MTDNPQKKKTGVGYRNAGQRGSRKPEGGERERERRKGREREKGKGKGKENGA